MAFYQEQLDLRLRLGDVVEGLIAHTPHLTSLSHTERILEYKVDVDQLSRSVVLVPCCSIPDNSILVAPLKRIIGKYFENPYFEPDLTRINREMKGRESVTLADWNRMEQERRDVLSAARSVYALLDRFIYAPHELLKPYILKGRDVGHYMIDFRDTRKVNCDGIVSNEKEPVALFPGKLLQLSIETRQELRLKMVEYFGRIPEEDRLPTASTSIQRKSIIQESPLSLGTVPIWPDEDSNAD